MMLEGQAVPRKKVGRTKEQESGKRERLETRKKKEARKGRNGRTVAGRCRGIAISRTNIKVT
jgi:hypothetical protein